MVALFSNLTVKWQPLEKYCASSDLARHGRLQNYNLLVKLRASKLKAQSFPSSHEPTSGRGGSTIGIV
jgi:hypothetical protein